MPTRTYRHTFTVQAPLEQVADFHAQSRSMGAITPPPVIAQVHRAPPRLGEGDEMEFTLWMGPIPLRWLARIEEVSLNGFTDRQLRGPFAAWRHRHSFEALSEGATRVHDEIQAQPKNHLLWGAVGWLMWLSLPVLFAYRGWKTRRLLESARPAELAAK